MYYDDSVFCLSMYLFVQHLRNLKTKDSEQDNVSPKKVNETDADNGNVAETFTGYSKNSKCTGSSFTISEEGGPFVNIRHPKHQKQ